MGKKLIKTTALGIKTYRDAQEEIKEKKEKRQKLLDADKALQGTHNKNSYVRNVQSGFVTNEVASKKKRIAKRRKANKVARASRKANR